MFASGETAWHKARDKFVSSLFIFCDHYLTIVETITELVELAFVLIKSKGRNKKNVGFKCAVSKVQVEW